jgi:hypothetical protein
MSYAQKVNSSVDFLDVPVCISGLLVGTLPLAALARTYKLNGPSLRTRDVPFGCWYPGYPGTSKTYTDGPQYMYWCSILLKYIVLWTLVSARGMHTRSPYGMLADLMATSATRFRAYGNMAMQYGGGVPRTKNPVPASG